MLKNMITLGLLAVPAALAAQTAVNVEARATIVGARRLTQLQQMNFGNIIAPPPAAAGARPEVGVVRLTHPGGREVIGNRVTLTSGPFSVAQFQFVGQPGQSFSLEPIAGFNLTRLDAKGELKDTMRAVVTSWKGHGSPAEQELKEPLTNPDGTRIFTLESMLEVAQGQAPGLYTGRYDVTLDLH